MISEKVSPGVSILVRRLPPRRWGCGPPPAGGRQWQCSHRRGPPQGVFFFRNRLKSVTGLGVDNKNASPGRDAIAKGLAERHPQRIAFGQGLKTSVRVERWGSRHRTGRYWAGLPLSLTS